MGKDIKARDTVEKSKRTGSVSAARNRAEKVARKAKNRISEETDNENLTPEEYASDKITEKISSGTSAAVNKTESAVNKSLKSTLRKVKKKKAQGKEEKENISNETEKKYDTESKKYEKTKGTDEKQEAGISRKKENHYHKKNNKESRKSDSDKKPVKASKGAKNTIKTTGNKAKASAKTVEKTKTTAKTTADAAKQSKRAAKVAAKATVKATKAVSKAIVETAKATAAAVKEIAAAVIAGGPVVIIIVVVCLIGAIGGTCFGIFLSNDKTTGTEKTMTETISLLTTEHYSEITDLQNRFSHEAFEIEGKTNINWKDVLTVYAVKTTTSEEDSQEVVTMNDIKLDILRKTVHDMNKVTGAIIKKYVPETIVNTDENGNSVSKVVFVEKNVLVVNVIQKSAAEMAEIYKFDDEQKKMVNELMSEAYDEMWNEIIGAAGDIIISNSTWQGTDIFKWPLPDNFYITSPFSYRKDPATGIMKFHGGTDIAAPQGTPILAPADGIVELATYNAGGYGYYVKLRHNETYETLFGHCSVLLVTAGQSVKQGQIIAQVGSTGYSTGPHLHYEVRQNGTRVNAMMFYS